MAKLSIKAGSTSKLIDVFIQDSSSTTGAGLTGLVFNTGSLTAYYYREGAGAAVAITLATMTLGTWATGGFIAIDGTNMPGMYQIGIPDAAIAAGAKSVVLMLKGASNMAPLLAEIELTAVDNQSATAFITGVNSVAPPTNWNLTSIDGSGRLDVIKIAGTTQTARDLGASVLLSPGTGTGQISISAGAVTVGTNNDKTGYSLTQSFPSNFALLSIDGSGRVDVAKIAGTSQTARDLGASVLLSPGTGTGQVSIAAGAVTVGTNNDKTGYSLTQAFPSNFATLSIDGSGRVTYVPGEMAVKKNANLNNFQFLLVSSTDHVTPVSDLTVTATRSIDGAPFAACSNSATSLSNGIYNINLTAADLNGTVITLRFTATGADDRFVTVLTQA